MRMESRHAQPTAPQAVRLVRILRISLIVSVLLSFWIVLKVPATPGTLPKPLVEVVIPLLALTNVVLGFFVPGFLLRGAEDRLTGMRSATAVQRWVSDCVLSLALLESCCLFGVVLHFIGARARIVGILFAVGLLAMAFWSPGTPPGEDGVARPQNWTGS